MKSCGRVCLVGDRASQIRFFRLIIPADLHESYNTYCSSAVSICIKKSYSFRFEENNKNLTIFSPFFPCGTELFVENEEDNWRNAECDMVVFLFSFPYNTENNTRIFMDISDYLKRNKESPVRFKIVFFEDPERKFSYTDITDPKCLLEEAKNHVSSCLIDKHLNMIVDHVICNDENTFYSIFNGGDKTMCYLSEIKKDVFLHWKNDVYKELNHEYSIIKQKKIGNFEMDSLCDCFKYENVGNTSDLVRKYCQNLFNNKAWTDLCSEIKMMYIGLIANERDGICFWDEEADAAKIIAGMSSSAERFITQKCETFSFNGTSFDYDKTRASTKIDINFCFGVKEYISLVLPEYIRSKIKEKIELFKMEE